MRIPISFSQPVGLTVDKDNNIWIAADLTGYVLVFNPLTNTFVKSIKLSNLEFEYIYFVP